MAVTAKQIEVLATDGDDPAQAARAAGLRHVSDRRSGITRRRSGKGFTYLGPDGKTIRDAQELGRIRSLAVLPAVVRLLETTLIRVGNDEYAKENRSYGLTTMRERHVKVRGDAIRFEFV